MARSAAGIRWWLDRGVVGAARHGQFRGLGTGPACTGLQVMDDLLR